MLQNKTHWFQLSGIPKMPYMRTSRHAAGDPCPRKGQTPVCINCKGNHLATSMDSPVVAKQRMISSLAAAENIPLFETRKKLSQDYFNTDIRSAELLSSTSDSSHHHHIHKSNLNRSQNGFSKLSHTTEEIIDIYLMFPPFTVGTDSRC